MGAYHTPAHQQIELDTWRLDLSRSVQKQSVAIAAVYAAADALDAVAKHREEQIMEQYMAQATADVTRSFDSL